ncbi:MAG: cell division protein ZapA [Myxococcales bacterium]|nr:cell division protein ZapA [Myxococcales bacterium]
MKRSVSVEIAGRTYPLRSDGDDATVRRLAADVDARIRAVMKSGRGVDTQQVAVLVALQLAEALERERLLHAKLKADVRTRGQALLALIERHALV